MSLGSVRASNHVCKEHVDELVPKVIGQKFQCFVCHQHHQVPFDGFILNQMASQMINMNVHLNENTKKVAELVSNLQVEHPPPKAQSKAKALT